MKILKSKGGWIGGIIGVIWSLFSTQRQCFMGCSNYKGIDVLLGNYTPFFGIFGQIMISLIFVIIGFIIGYFIERMIKRKR